MPENRINPGRARIATALAAVAVGAATFGYSDHASLGRYRLTGALPDIAGDGSDPDGDEPDPEPELAAPSTPSPTATVADGSVTVDWGDDPAAAPTFAVYRESLHKNGSYRGRTLLGVGTESTWVDTPGSGTFRYHVVATNSSGSAESDLIEVTVTSSTADGSTKGGKGGGGGKSGAMKTR